MWEGVFIKIIFLIREFNEFGEIIGGMRVDVNIMNRPDLLQTKPLNFSCMVYFEAAKTENY